MRDPISVETQPLEALSRSRGSTRFFSLSRWRESTRFFSLSRLRERVGVREIGVKRLAPNPLPRQRER